MKKKKRKLNPDEFNLTLLSGKKVEGKKRFFRREAGYLSR